MSEQGSNGNGQPAGVPVRLRFAGGAPTMLPKQVPKQRYRQAQSNIPDDKKVRALLKKTAEDHVKKTGAVPPLTLDELREHTAVVLQQTGVDLKFKDYVAILVSNAAWRDTIAKIPY